MGNVIKDASGMIILVCFTVLLLVFTLRTVWEPTSIQQQAIERGYALHCPLDGRFAWKGECEDG